MVEEKPTLDGQVELLKLNHTGLHEAVWKNHQASWTVTSIFIPVLFAMFGFLVKEYNDGFTNLQAAMAFLAMEGLLLIWYAFMRIFDQFNDVRRAKLKEIEEKLKELVPEADFKMYKLRYGQAPRLFKFPIRTIYLAMVCFFTDLNIIFLTIKLDHLTIGIVIAILFTAGAWIFAYYEKKSERKKTEAKQLKKGRPNMGNFSPMLAVSDMKKTIDFYTKSLGFELGICVPTPENPEYADLSKDGMVLMFIPTKNIGISGEEKLGTGVNLYLQIDGDIDKYYNKLKQKGVKIAVDIKNEPFGIRDFTVEDPDGYKLTFNQDLRKA